MNRADYDHFCTEDVAESRRKSDSIRKNIVNETYIEKDCKIDEIRFLSKFWETFVIIPERRSRQSGEVGATSPA